VGSEHGKHLYDWKETVGGNLVTPDASGERIRIEGAVIDGDGRPIPDAMIEIWQADAQGRYAHPRDNQALPNVKFKGFGRSACDTDGVYAFDTIKPGRVPGPGGKQQAPHIVVAVFSRGMLRQIYTRLYFSDEKSNADDSILTLVPQDRRGALIAHKETRGRVDRLPLRHPGAGRKRDGFLRDLTDRLRIGGVGRCFGRPIPPIYFNYNGGTSHFVVPIVYRAVGRFGTNYLILQEFSKTCRPPTLPIFPNS
jgi:protocatechuate 3,4-dioxygenase alpha subunit